ncbi:hypothetical protein CYY_008701 [Polysphondylium violaceum]|uniref:PH domain-containing protein n=1 Tax=Polysphondylium violaceum TaxID=133409 RepID=A0A8J4UWQ8_9MYCE|nr:hypothetical protein CYY_008701 [Polysphondylium violaceum]
MNTNNTSVKVKFTEVKELLDQVHRLVDSDEPSDLNKAATILKSLLPIYKDLSANEESKRPENLEVLKEIKIRLTEETSRVMKKKEDTKQQQAQQYQQQQQQLQQQQIADNTNRKNTLSNSISSGSLSNLNNDQQQQQYYQQQQYQEPNPIIMKPPLLQGYLKKQGEKGIVKSFKKRWFQQKDTKLYYYDKEGDTQSYGFINLPDMTSTKTVDSGFELVTPTRVYVLQVLKPSDLNYWTEGLKEYKKYYQSLQNTQKFAADGSNPLPPGIDRRPSLSASESPYTPIKDTLRRGTVSYVESPVNNSNRDNGNLSSSYNSNNGGGNFMEEHQRQQEIERREAEIKKRVEEQEQRKKQEESMEQQKQRDLQIQLENERKKLELELAQQKKIKERESELQRIKDEEMDQKRRELIKQQEEEIKKRLQYQSNNNSDNNSNTSNSNYNSPSYSNNNNNNNNSSYNSSPIIQSNNSSNNHHSISTIEYEAMKRVVEEETKKRLLKEQDEILEIEKQRRDSLENEIYRLKDLIKKSEAEAQSTQSLKFDIQLRNEEIDRLKKEQTILEQNNESLENKIAELSAKPLERFPAEFKWAEEITIRDKKIVDLQSQLRSLDESLKLKENTATVIKRENEMLRQETEKKDKYITDLLDKTRDIKNSPNAKAMTDVVKLRESLQAHQTQNSFLLSEIQKLETASKMGLEIQQQHNQELEFTIQELIDQFHSFRGFLLGTTQPTDYFDKIEKENLEIKREYFQTLGVSIKLFRIKNGDATDNIDVRSLFELAIKENIPFRSWPEWIGKNIETGI